MNSLDKRLLTSAVFLLILFCCNFSLFAAGAIFVYDKGEWELFDQEQQFCAINYDEGMQRMVLGVSTEKEFYGERAIWIFPLPAKPEEVEVCSLVQFPAFIGLKVHEKATNLLALRLSIARFGQVYTIPEGQWIGNNRPMMHYFAPGEDPSFNWYIQEKHGLFDGISNDFVAFQNGEEMGDYLEMRNIVLPDAFLDLMREYVKEKYSFAFVSIDNVKEFNMLKREFELRVLKRKMVYNTMGMHIRFPTSKIYYPLRSAGINRGTVIPVTIYIIGFVQPDFDYNLQDFSCINHMFCPAEYYWMAYDQRGFYKPITYNDDLKFTKIDIFANSGRFENDLFINTRPALDAERRYFILKISGWYAIVAFILSSCLACLISWRIIFKRWMFSKWRIALFGLFNILTIVGFSLASYLMRTKELPAETRENPLDHWLNASSYLSKKHLVTLVISLSILALFVFFGKLHRYFEILDIILFMGISLGIVLVSLHLSTKIVGKDGLSYNIVDFKKLLFLLGFNIFLIIVGQILYNTQLEKIEKIATIIGYTYETDYGNGISLNHNFGYLFSLFKFTLSIIVLIPVNLLFTKKFRKRGVYIIPRDNRKIGFVLMFSVTFVILTYIFQFALKSLL